MGVDGDVAHNAADTYVPLLWYPLCWDRVVGPCGWDSWDLGLVRTRVRTVCCCWWWSGGVARAVPGLDSLAFPDPDPFSGDPGIELTSGLVC